MKRPDFPFAGAWFRLGKNHELHLIVSKKRTHQWALPKTAEIAYPHLAVIVEDTEKTQKQLTMTGHHFFDRISPHTGFRQLFILDPDGNMIEFIGETTIKQARSE